MLPNSERADDRALLRRAQHLAVTRGGQQVTVEHVTLALLEREPGIRRHWRSLGIDDDRAVRELGVTKALAEGHPGRGHRFHTAVSDELVITPEVTQLLRACAEVQGADDRDAAAGLAATLLTFLPPLPGSLMRDDETGGSAESGSAVAGSGASAGSADAAGAAGELSEHGSDLTRLALLGKLDPMIGRERELNGLIRVLSRRRKSNPLLVGEPGVGKTALVEGLALRIAHGNAGSRLADARVVSVSLASLLAGTRYRGEFEARVHALLGEVTSADRRTILFVDEFHLIVKAGAAEGGLDLGSLLLAGMARDELAVIGATTPDLYREHLRSAGPLARRVQVIEVGEPSRDETLQILRGIRTQYQDFHGVHITDGALQTAIRLSGRVGRRRPDAAIELVDDAAAAVALSVVAGQEMATVAEADVVGVFRQRTDIAGRFSGRRLASRRSRW